MGIAGRTVQEGIGAVRSGVAVRSFAHLIRSDNFVLDDLIEHELMPLKFHDMDYNYVACGTPTAVPRRRISP